MLLIARTRSGAALELVGIALEKNDKKA